MTIVTLTLSPRRRCLIWLIGVFFVLFQFFLQLSSGVLISALTPELKLSALTAGLLSSSFYFVYTTLQIPVGILFDKYNTRFLLASNALLCSLGCLVFAKSHSLSYLILGRLLIGAGSSFAFVGLSQLIRDYFPPKRFAFIIGLSETLGFLITVLAIISLGQIINCWGWRQFILSTSSVGLLISFLCCCFIPDKTLKVKTKINHKQQLKSILKSYKAWFNGLFVGLSFTVITAFAAMWAVPFVQVKLHCSLEQASIIDAMVFLGAGLSCPLFGQLTLIFANRRALMLLSCLLTALLITLALYLPLESPLILGFFMLMIGVSCGAYMLAFSIANELAPPQSLATMTGFTNTLAMLTAPLAQISIGFLLDYLAKGQAYSLGDYQRVLLLIPLSLVVAGGLICFLPEGKEL